MGRDGLTRLLSHTAFLEQARVTVVRKRRDPDRSVAWVMITRMDLEWWRRAADDALLAAKAQGRARVILAPPSTAAPPGNP